MEVIDSAGASVSVDDNGALDTDPAVGVIAVNVELLNPMLTDLGFTSLRATSNAPGVDVRPLLTITGEVVRAAAAVAKSTVTVRVSDNDFFFAGACRIRTHGSQTFLNTGEGDRFSGSSFLDPANVLFGTAVRGPDIVTTPHHPARADDLPISQSQNPRPTCLPAIDGPFALTAAVDVTLGTAAAVNESRSVQFATAAAATKP